MYALLGDFEGNLFPDPYSRDFVYARVSVYHEIGGPPKTEVIVVKNSGATALVYNLPVNIWDEEIASIWNYGVPIRPLGE